MILALCGTVEGKELLEKLSNTFPVVATVTTPYGVQCLGDYPNVEIIQKNLQQQDLVDLLEERKIKVVIDVSHPYAQIISLIALEACRKKGILYLRYERQETPLEDNPMVIYAKDFHHAADIAKGYGGKVFLTIGSNHIPLFVKGLGADRLIARVLPVSKVIELCEENGLTPDHIIAMKGPFTERMNEIMFSMEGVSVVVTKDSGEAGGTLEKIRAAKTIGIPIILVKRPEIPYGKVYHSIEDLINSLNHKI